VRPSPIAPMLSQQLAGLRNLAYGQLDRMIHCPSNDAPHEKHPTRSAPFASISNCRNLHILDSKGEDHRGWCEQDLDTAPRFE
jgi:hypothetical protein